MFECSLPFGKESTRHEAWLEMYVSWPKQGAGFLGLGLEIGGAINKVFQHLPFGNSSWDHFQKNNEKTKVELECSDLRQGGEVELGLWQQSQVPYFRSFGSLELGIQTVGTLDWEEQELGLMRREEWPEPE
ncbi:unnamed protein product [Prunus armeniaca]|uniref:Uncharacterized protein n=1 Tax=Prunus armeniaca TaxID=36596 RepID=A0A6J5XRZ9_PRUAR|nr:unnamed protein product [Prunus armeniaca]